MLRPPPAEAAEVVKIVGDKTFVYRDAVWTDTTFDPSRMATQAVGFGGKAYFDLLAARPDLGVYFALGDRVIVVVDGTAYQIAASDSGSISVPPTVTPRPESARPTPAPVTPDVSSSGDAKPINSSQSESQKGGLSGLCPGTVLAGLVLVPLAMTKFRRKGKK